MGVLSTKFRDRLSGEFEEMKDNMHRMISALMRISRILSEPVRVT